jgi:hypothetical protein
VPSPVGVRDHVGAHGESIREYRAWRTSVEFCSLFHARYNPNSVGLPNNRLPASALGTATAGLVAVVCLAMVARAVLPLSAWYPVKAGALFSIVMLLALGHVRGHHPFAQFGPANQVTTVRAILVVLVASLIGEPGLPPVAATAATVGHGATVQDGMDGWLARQAGMASAFGARFDVEIDALRSRRWQSLRGDTGRPVPGYCCQD